MVIAVGSRIKDYEVVAHLRDGGMASLFIAKRVGVAGFAKPVAIKIVHPQFSQDESFVRMFVDEAIISARIDHPNVVHTIELGEFEGHYFLAMEYVQGTSLAHLLAALAKRGRRLTPELAVHIALRMAEGLHAAHETTGDAGEPLHIVHRDVSPQNVLVSTRGHVKIIDFGVAKAASRAHQTTAASLKGKIRYMAPEQAFGRMVDRRSDVYAIGIVLWEMLTMRRLFHADDDFALLDIVREPKVPPPSSYASEVSAALDAVVLKALSPTQDGRYASARDLRNALAEALPNSASLEANTVSAVLDAVAADIPELRKGSSVSSAIGDKQDSSSKAFQAFTVSDKLVGESKAPATAGTHEQSPHGVQITRGSQSQVMLLRGRGKWILGVAAVVGLGVAGGYGLTQVWPASSAVTAEPQPPVNVQPPVQAAHQEPVGVTGTTAPIPLEQVTRSATTRDAGTGESPTHVRPVPGTTAPRENNKVHLRRDDRPRGGGGRRRNKNDSITDQFDNWGNN